MCFHKPFLANAPQRASGKDDSPGDPLNLVVIGNMEGIRRVFKEAGWIEAEQKTGKSTARIFLLLHSPETPMQLIWLHAWLTG